MDHENCWVDRGESKVPHQNLTEHWFVDREDGDKSNECEY